MDQPLHWQMAETAAVDSRQPPGCRRSSSLSWAEMGAVDSRQPPGCQRSLSLSWEEMGATDSRQPPGCRRSSSLSWAEKGAVDSHQRLRSSRRLAGLAKAMASHPPQQGYLRCTCHDWLLAVG